MQNEVREQLELAYRLIKRDQTGDAQELLRPILEDDAENVHAWWLLAYASSDADEIRYALNRVLALQPDYSNAGKARELLEALDVRFPQPEDLDDLSFDETLDEDVTVEADEFMPGGQVYEGEAHVTQEELRESAETEVLPTTEMFEELEDESTDVAALSAAADLFDDLDSGLLSADESSETLTPEELFLPDDDQEELEALLNLESGFLEDSTPAAQTQRSRRRRRAARLSALIVLALVVAASGVALWALLLRDDAEGNADPGPLVSVAIEAPNLQQVLRGLESELTEQNVGAKQQAVIAQSAHGTTLFAEFCIKAPPQMTGLVPKSTLLVTEQVSEVAEYIDAVGVSVYECGREKYDTLYRATTPVANALRYTTGEFGNGEIAFARYQALWSQK